MEEQKKQIESTLQMLNDKTFNLYFFTLDTKGNPTAGIANIYEHVKLLNELGYNASILHEKNDYKLKGDDEGQGIAEWLGEEYAQLPHVSIEGQQLNVGPADFIIIPEIFSNIMDQVKTFPCRKVVMSQSYDYLLELLPIGKYKLEDLQRLAILGKIDTRKMGTAGNKINKLKSELYSELAEKQNKTKQNKK